MGTELEEHGKIIMETLQSFGTSTFQKIVKKISQNYEVDMDEIKLPIKKVLQTGVKNGFLEKINGKFAISGVNKTDSRSVDSLEARHHFNDAPSDGSRSRSRSRRRSKSRSRRRSKSRRSRRRRR